MNDFSPSPDQGSFDRVVSVEMFEHMRNWPELLRRISRWLADDGKLFIHIFCHRAVAYPFEVRDSSDWMARYFFTGGLMPSADLLPRAAAGILQPEEEWPVSGVHYAKTSRAWLENLDRNEQAVRAVLADTYGQKDVETWWNRWRIFYMACEELFGFRHGSEWQVGHYRLVKG